MGLIALVRYDLLTRLGDVFSDAGQWETEEFLLLYFLALLPILWFAGRRWIEARSERRKRKFAEMRLARGQEEIYRANQTCSHFLSNMSHELRTPLNAVIGFSHIIKDEMYGPVGVDVYREYAKDIHDSGNLLLGLVSDLLDLSRIEEGIYELHPTNLDMEKLVGELNRLLKEVFHRKNLRFNIYIEKDIPLLPGDEKAIKQILYNLLNNAIKFSHKGGEVWLNIRQVHSEMVIIIGDSGPGLSARTRKYFFEPFSRFHEKYQANETNLGLGLMVVKSLVEMHGAHIDIASATGKGTQVILKFKLAQEGFSSSRNTKSGEVINLDARRQKTHQR